MTWQNPWALLGLAALALPVLIHLLSRKRASLQKFPTLRFLNATRLEPTRSPNLTDIPLLILRLAVFAFAAFALTQPAWISSSRQQSLRSAVARVIVVDSSASMLRAGAGARTPHDSAMTVAQQMATESQGSLIVQTATPADALGGASAWLLAQHLRGEVVVLSDFQSGTIDSAATTRVDRTFGLKLVRVSELTPAAKDSGVTTTAGRVVAIADSKSTRAEWTSATTAVDGSVTLLARESDREIVAAAERAARIVAPHGRTRANEQSAVVFEGAPQTAAIVSSAKLPSQGWMSDAIVAVRNNHTLAAAARDASVADSAVTPAFAVVARTATGVPVVFAAQATVNGTEQLVFFHRGGPSAFTAPALLVAIADAVAEPLNLHEFQNTALSDAELRRLEHAGIEVDAAATSADNTAANRAGLSDARWIWLFVLLLLAVEWWLRNRVDREAPVEAA